MDRRDFLLSLAMGSAASLLGAATASGAAETVSASATGIKPGASQSAAALQEFIELLGEVNSRYLSAEYGNEDPVQQSMGRRFLAHAIEAAMRLHLEADPAHPRWVRFVDPQLKLLGDNPDALYYSTPVDPKFTYRIKGNIHNAAYTSFTVEAGTTNGNLSKHLLATLNDTQFDIAPDGSYELIAGGPKRNRNWLDLGKDAGSITTRHYFEWETSAAADPLLNIPLTITNMEDQGPAAPLDDAAIAAGWRRVSTFLRGVTLGMPLNNFSIMPPFMSREFNRFPLPNQKIGNRGVGFGAADNTYLGAYFKLAPDEALVMRGRFPKCRFANVVLFNRFAQTFDYTTRRVSLNRKQTRYEPDGSFRMIIAARNPGVKNWLDTEGQETGQILWRFQLAEEQIEPVAAEVVKLGAVAKD